MTDSPGRREWKVGDRVCLFPTGRDDLTPGEVVAVSELGIRVRLFEGESAFCLAHPDELMKDPRCDG